MQHPKRSDYYALSPDSHTDSGCFELNVLDEEGCPVYDEHGDEVYIGFEDVMAFVAEGEVMIVQSIGSERLRYLSAYAQAYVRKGDQVSSVHLSLDDIYDRAAKAFNISDRDIAPCEYTTLSQNITVEQHASPKP